MSPTSSSALRQISIIGIATVLLLAACGGNSGGAVQSAVAALTLASSSPANGDTGVARGVAPQLVFSTGLNSATATASNVTLTHEGGAATLTFAVAGTQLTLTPSRSLLPLTTYTLRAGTGVEGIGGERLPIAEAISFTTADGSWRTAQLIETDDAGAAVSPAVAFDADGNAFAVWSQTGGTPHSIWANRYTSGIGWGTAQLIEADNAGMAVEPQIAVDGSGNAFAVWYQSDGTRNNIWANRYAAGIGWGTAQLLEADAGNARSPRIAVDGSGNAFAVWYQHDGARNNIWTNRYAAGTGWGTAQLIETDAGNARFPRIAVDGSGNAFAVWYQDDGVRDNIWSNRYAAGTGWGTAQLIETDAGNAQSPRIAVDGSGNAFAIWSQLNGPSYSIWTNRYAPDSGWGAAQLIEIDDAGNADRPQITVDRSGNAFAIWYQSDGVRDNIWSNRYAAGTGWGTAQLIETDAGNAESPRIAVDGSGNALATWRQHDGVRNNLWSNRYAANTGWGTAQLIETDNAGGASSQEIAIDDEGNALAVWQQFDGTRTNIWSNRFD